MPVSARKDVLGVVLAGGLARRMGGGDKGLLELGGRPILDHVLERLAPQVAQIVLNANGDPARFAAYPYPVAPDTIEGFAGPLAGVLAGLEWARANAPDIAYIVTIATDTPFFPVNLVQCLADAAATGQADMACAASNGRNHPVVGLWPVRLADDLRHALVEDDIRKVDVWTARYRLAVAQFEAAGHDPFFNANRPDDLAEAEAILKELAA